MTNSLTVGRGMDAGRGGGGDLAVYVNDSPPRGVPARNKPGKWCHGFAQLLDVGPPPGLGTGPQFLASAGYGRFLEGDSSRGLQRRVTRGVGDVAPRLRCLGERPIAAPRTGTPDNHSFNQHDFGSVDYQVPAEPAGCKHRSRALLEPTISAETELYRTRTARRNSIGGNATPCFRPLPCSPVGSSLRRGRQVRSHPVT